MRSNAIALGLSLLTAGPAAALTITLTFSGTIGGVSDNTGALVGSNIVAGSSTFSGTFVYDSSAAPTFVSSFAAVYPGGPLTLTIDGAHTFFEASPGNFRVQNDDENFHDTFEFFENSGATFPFTANPNDQLLRVSFRDSTNAVFSDQSLPNSLDLGDFDTRELFIRTDLDRAAGQLWTISGTVTSLSVTVPEAPANLAALLLAAALGLRSCARRRS